MIRPDIMRLLLVAGIAAGFLFILVSAVESFVRPGFDLKRHAISMLSLGDRGWLMVVTFILSGALTLLCAVGLRAAEGGLWGPLLIAVYGLGLIIAGIFPAPASFQRIDRRLLRIRARLLRRGRNRIGVVFGSGRARHARARRLRHEQSDCTRHRVLYRGHCWLGLVGRGRCGCDALTHSHSIVPGGFDVTS
jgi:hypothetical protein